MVYLACRPDRHQQGTAVPPSNSLHGQHVGSASGRPGITAMIPMYLETGCQTLLMGIVGSAYVRACIISDSTNSSSAFAVQQTPCPCIDA